MKKLRIAIAGPNGRMGSQLIKCVEETKNIVLSVIITKSCFNFEKKNSLIRKIDNFNAKITNDINSVINNFDILIDFTRPENTLKNLLVCYQNNKSIVIGTTGFDESGRKIIQDAAKKIPIVYSSNFSIGINLLFKLIEKTTEIIGNSSDIDIIEKHHRQKKDCPSGTALTIGEKIAQIMNWNLKESMFYNNINNIAIRPPKVIEFSSIRSGEIIGEHTVLFHEKNEQIEITHKAINRKIFASGAVKAAIWIEKNKKEKGLFDMQDVLNLKNIF
ncbi:4-hydroxy-tetrahydrodipicolinate reductase [Candidatus Tachikawaea gelatinosa]|nr:4-hydroxy-tetrahydrodipicolinate reductase [Candidatus Tachikawaea gelatinosa]